MAEKIRLILNGEKRIRDAIVKDGTALLEGVCLGKFTAVDIDKAIKRQEVNIAVVRETKEKEK